MNLYPFGRKTWLVYNFDRFKDFIPKILFQALERHYTSNKQYTEIIFEILLFSKKCYNNDRFKEKKLKFVPLKLSKITFIAFSPTFFRKMVFVLDLATKFLNLAKNHIAK